MHHAASCAFSNAVRFPALRQDVMTRKSSPVNMPILAISMIALFRTILLHNVTALGRREARCPAADGWGFSCFLDQEEELTIRVVGVAQPFIGPLHLGHHIPLVVDFHGVKDRAVFR